MFKYKGNLRGNDARVLRKFIVAASITIKVGDSVKWATGYATLNTTGIAVLGHVAAICANDISDLAPSSNGAGGDFVDTYTTAADNTTVGKISVLVDISRETIYQVEADATLGTTTGSNLPGYYLDVVDEDTLDESSALTTTCQYASLGPDPADTTKLLVVIKESYLGV